ncbi:MAG: glycoside hydrolase family 5 protein [Ignavibacteriaceae bacterium]|nr:glycoside hydrolase family 5 protein [Ignavibacteriaceae bacterium]
MSNIKYELLVVIIISVATITLQAQNNGFVTTKGKQIISPDGKELKLKGINIGNWLEPEGYMFKFKKAESTRKIYEVFNELLGPDAANKFWNEFRGNYINEEDIKFIKEHGFNSVRVPFHYKLFTGIDYSDNCLHPGFELLDKVIKWCSKYGIYAILDLHCAPGGQTGDNIDDSWGYPYLYENAESQELTVKIWKEIAERYKDEKYVLGYDLLNEPIAHYFDTNKLNPLLEPLYIKITKAIREADKNHIIILGGAQWDSNFKVFGKPFDSKLVYTFHKYWSDTTQTVIQDYIDFRDKYNVPIWLGESGENNMAWVNSFRTLLDNNDIGWCFWTFKRLDTDHAIVSIQQPEGYDKIMDFADSLKQTFSDIRKINIDRGLIQNAASGYLENIKLKNCKTNTAYLESLGLK